MAKKIFRVIGPLLLLAYFITLVLHISAFSDQYQWDFRTHRKAGEIMAAGSDPYDPEVLLSHKEAGFLYTYPPVTLWIYWLFSLTDYDTAFHIFLIGKCVLLIGLIIFWKSAFLGPKGDSLFYLFSLLDPFGYKVIRMNTSGIKCILSVIKLFLVRLTRYFMILDAGIYTRTATVNVRFDIIVIQIKPYIPVIFPVVTVPRITFF